MVMAGRSSRLMLLALMTGIIDIAHGIANPHPKSELFAPKVPTNNNIGPRRRISSTPVRTESLSRPLSEVSSTSTDAEITKLKQKVQNIEEQVHDMDVLASRLGTKISSVERQVRNLGSQMTVAQTGTSIKFRELETANQLLRRQFQELREETRQCQRSCIPLTNIRSRNLQTPDQETLPTPDQLQFLQDTVETVQEHIAIIIEQTGVNIEESELDTFLGNREAVLLDPEYSPSAEGTLPPPVFDRTPSPEDAVSKDEMLSRYLNSLSNQNQELSSKVTHLEQELQGKGTIEVTNSSPELEDRLRAVETLAVSAFARQDRTSRIAGVSGGKEAAGQFGGSTDEQIEQIVGGINPTSVFSVARTSHMIGQLRHPQEVLFDHVFARKGINYNQTNGTFTCKHTGFYFVTFTARTFDYKYFGVTLMKNEEPLAALFSDKHNRNVMQTQSIIVHLREGDRLWIRLPPSDKYAIDSDNHKMITFSGFLLYKGEM